MWYLSYIDIVILHFLVHYKLDKMQDTTKTGLDGLSVSDLKGVMRFMIACIGKYIKHENK